MLRYLVAYSDLIGGFLGIFGSIILAYPYIGEITDRRQWELLLEFRRLIADRRNDGAENLDAYRDVRDRMIDDRLGQHLRYRWVTMVGLLALVAAFAFMTIASLTRQSGS
jgi:hypothetical protein